jgi:quercetin dioxygenase-like cupin family protein
MKEIKVIRLEDTERVSFGPLSHYQPIVGDDAGGAPVRTGIQTAQPGYAAPVHSHPYIEIRQILDGVAEAWIDGKPESLILLRKGDTIAVPPETPHAFRVVGEQELRLLGTHVSPKRIVNYQDGVASDARGYRSEAS